METIELEPAEGQPEVELFPEEEPSSEGQLQPEGEPEGKPEQDEKVCQRLLEEAKDLRNDELETRFLLGKKLYQLQQQRAKPGHGSFKRDVVNELEIPIATAYRRIAFYKDVKAGRKRINVERLYQRDKDGWVVEDVAELEAELREIEERQAADQRAKEQEEIKKQAEGRANEEREREEKTGETAPLHVKLHLKLPEKKQCNQAQKALGPMRTTEIVYVALMSAYAEFQKTKEEEVVADARV